MNQPTSKMPVAVLAFHGDGIPAEINDLLRTTVEGVLVNEKRFRTLDRIYLQDVLTEQQLSDALSNPDEALALGQLTPAHVFIVADLFKHGETGVEMKARVINTETSEIVAVLDAFVDDHSSRDLIQQGCENLAAQINALYPRLSGEVVSARSSQMLLNWTEEDGVRPGAYVLLVEEEEPWIDEDTGEILEPGQFIEVGRAKIESASSSSTRARTVESDQEGVSLEKACLLSPCSLLLLLALVFAPTTMAQLEINSAPSPVGSGARALGMGGAFIAIADDATAASWNPGGLTQLERPELSLVYSYKWFGEDLHSSAHYELNSDNDVSFNDINYFSFVYPIRRTWKGRNFVLSLNYLKKYDFDRDFDFGFNNIAASNGAVVTIPGVGNISIPGGIINSVRSKYHYRQRGSLSTLSPAFGMELTDKLSVGLVVNIWDQSILSDNEWKTRNEVTARASVNGVPQPRTVLKVEEDFEDFEGTNYSAGFLYKPNDRWGIGGVYHSKFTGDVKYTIRQQVRVAGIRGIPTMSRRDKHYTFPSSAGIGVSYRFPNDKLTLSLDITRTEWEQFEILDPQNRNPFMRRMSGVSGMPKSRTPKIDPTYTVRLGMEHVFVDTKNPSTKYMPIIRAGVFYDPEPSTNRSNSFWGMGVNTLRGGDGKPDKFYGVSLGAGVLMHNRVNLDVAYTYRWGKDVRRDTLGLGWTDFDVDQHLLYFSTVIYF